LSYSNYTQNFSGQDADVDARSVYVGGVDYSSTPEELQTHFQSCGTINRVTILCDKYTGKPKGCVFFIECFFDYFFFFFEYVKNALKSQLFIQNSFAYVEFTEEAAVEEAKKLDGSLFKGRALKVRSVSWTKIGNLNEYKK
jgi:polyadenylate-binding protein 2